MSDTIYGIKDSKSTPPIMMGIAGIVRKEITLTGEYLKSHGQITFEFPEIDTNAEISVLSITNEQYKTGNDVSMNGSMVCPGQSLIPIMSAAGRFVPTVSYVTIYGNKVHINYDEENFTGLVDDGVYRFSMVVASTLQLKEV